MPCDARELLSGSRREAYALASRLRGAFFTCLTRRHDELFELTDAVLCAEGPVKSPVDPTSLAEHRRGHSALHGGLGRGDLDVERLRRLLAGLPLPRYDGGRLVLAVDVSPWLRPDAPCSAERLFCHVCGRAKDDAQVIPGWPYSLVAASNPAPPPGPRSWMLSGWGPRTTRPPSPRPSCATSSSTWSSGRDVPLLLAADRLRDAARRHPPDVTGTPRTPC